MPKSLIHEETTGDNSGGNSKMPLISEETPEANL